LLVQGFGFTLVRFAHFVVGRVGVECDFTQTSNGECCFKREKVSGTFFVVPSSRSFPTEGD
jgi:hypothetical protein